MENLKLGKILEKNKSLLYIIVGTLVILAVVFFLLSLYVHYSIVLAEYEVPVSFNISNVSGFDLTKESLKFGKIVPGSSGTRYISIENPYKKRVVVELNISENLMKFLSYEPLIIIDSGEKKRIGFSVVVPINATYSSYEGVLKIVVKKDMSKPEDS